MVLRCPDIGVRCLIPTALKSPRVYRRAAAEHASEVEAIGLVKKLKGWMDKKRLTIRMWFDLMDASSEETGSWDLSSR